MAVAIKDTSGRPAYECVVGRSAELSELLNAFARGVRVTYLHGLAGIGKSTLLVTFAQRARAIGAKVVSLDCRAMEPTERGFLNEISILRGESISSPQSAAKWLGSLGPQVVVLLDNFEVYCLMDTWLRQVFIPRLPENVQLLLSGNGRPVLSWHIAASPAFSTHIMELGPLSQAESLELLASGGIAENKAAPMSKFARGHPLALRLALEAADKDFHQTVSGSDFHRIVEDLTKLYLTDIRDPLTRQAVEAASVVRRTTLSLLQAMLPDASPRDAFERLQGLPFIEPERDGLRMNDLVRQAVGSTLRAADPAGYQDYRRSAWRQLKAEAENVGISDLWRYTADLLFLIENPVVREAFFPSASAEYVVEPARADDFAAIDAICREHDPPSSCESISLWRRHTPESFRVVRGPDGLVSGFYLMFDPALIDPAALRNDPATRRWWEHVRKQPMPAGQSALFLRRWLSREHGEAPSSVQAACWLDIKRSYMEMRPRLRRVYLAVTDLSAYASAALLLGFRPLQDLEIKFDEVVYSTAMLDFGSASVDGWLAGLAAAELGVEIDALLDIDAHELVLDDGRVKLSKMEFDIFHFLYQNEGKAVTRASLIENVWGYKHSGSNVVDATVKSLRKKLGAKSSSIETIRGSGYRFQKL